MSVYIFQEEEPFAQIFEDMRKTGRDATAQMLVRRPVRGLQIEKDTYAYLKVVDINGNDMMFTNSGGTNLSKEEAGIGKSSAYSNFLLQKVTIARAELKQFVKTFGLTYLFLFGENPIMITVEGGLVHSADFRWDEEWWVNYESMLRATRLAESGARAYLCYEGIMIEGYILNSTTARDAQVRHLVPLGFEMVATDVKFLAKVGSTEFPRASNSITYDQVYSEGIDLHKLLPPNRRMDIDLRSRIAQLSREPPTSLLAGGLEQAQQAAVLPGGLGFPLGVGLAAGRGQTPDTTSLVFGSFQALFRTIAEAPALLAGLTGSSTAIRGADAGLAGHSLGTPQLPPKFGNIYLNRDEYVNLPPVSPFPGSATQGRIQLYNDRVTPEEEREMAGAAARQITESDGTSVSEPLASENGYGNGTAPGSEPNMSTIDGGTGGSGVSTLPNADMVDVPEDAIGDLPGTRGGSTPYPTTGIPSGPSTI